MNNKILYSILTISLFIMSVSLTSAGLVVSPAFNNLTKSSSGNLVFNFTIQNTESYPFYNISIEDNPYVSFITIPQLNSGSSAIITATSNVNSNLQNISLRIRGFNQAQIGASNQTININITAFQSTPCDLTLVKGDTVVWKNLLASDITLYNSDLGTPIDGSLMHSNQIYTRNFATAQILKYYPTISAFQFPQTCTITVLNDNGLVNDPQKDGVLNFNLKIDYIPTTMSSSAPVSSYTMNFNDVQDGVFTITNTGVNIAKNVQIFGEWLTFSSNNFDLGAGSTKAISYTIIPIITNTSQTNKTYNKNINVAGNFNSISIPLNISINHAIISNGDLSDSEALNATLFEFCSKYPFSRFCGGSSQVVYQLGNNTDFQEFNVSMTNAQFKAFMLSYIEDTETRTTAANVQKETAANISESVVHIANRLDSLDNRSQVNDKKLDDLQTNQQLLFGVGGGIILLTSLTGGILFFRRRKLMNQYG